MFDVVLFQPEIPPNTGNVIRLCANAGARLHLVEPLGFSLDDRRLRRAGLDYHDLAKVSRHADWSACLRALGTVRIHAISSRGDMPFFEARFGAGDAFVFGSETAGLPQEILEGFPARLRLRVPMVPGNRSINLSNTVAIVLFEAWRQQGFAGGA